MNSLFEVLILVRTLFLKYRTFSNKIVEVSNFFEQNYTHCAYMYVCIFYMYARLLLTPERDYTSTLWGYPTTSISGKLPESKGFQN